MKKRFFSILIPAMLLLAMASCSKSSFDYLGKSYPSSGTPEIFFRDQDVPQDYEVMGKVTAEVPYSKKLKYIQNKVMTVARENGADAVLFSDVNIRSTGTTRSSGGAATGRRVRVGGNVSRSTDNEVKNVEAVLLKYKSNIPSKSE
ncbi:MAG: hypothetical protein RBR47_09020 [Bacteroidales bacterium]|jgi:hypothetical protein|nr:hypothetical protein [Bacteroidales bacterium]MDD4177402.1 hypothetical protein [Bacteroidales bacterium]MDD4741297.1 hypothetical protein [Bacteroidales bacterium]MDY0335088.1 hypothetical protein [Bacteroidales bacterium]NCU34989.1 hypothetical protein [Candidatus Falkowbacteria bacterium]